MFSKETNGLGKLFNTTVSGNDSMKAFRNMNMMQGHIIRRPKPKDLAFDTCDENEADLSKNSGHRLSHTSDNFEYQKSKT